MTSLAVRHLRPFVQRWEQSRLVASYAEGACLTRWGLDAMPERVEQYRLNAEKCYELAQHFKDPDAKRTMFAMADAWLMLAAKRVKKVEPTRTIPTPPDNVPSDL